MASSNEKCWQTIIMVLNIIVGVVVASSALLTLMDYLDSTSSIEWLFMSISMFVLGVILIMTEIGWHRDDWIYPNLGLLKWYAGRGFYVLLYPHSP